MAAMLQHSPVTLRTQDNKMRFNQNNQQEAWSYPQEWQQQQQHINPYYHHHSYQQQYPLPYISQSPQHRPHRPRTQSATSNSSGIQPQKSSSTPSSHKQQRQRKHRPSPPSSSSANDLRRPKSTLIQQVPSSRPLPTPEDSGRRRSSITSTSSAVSQAVSIRSEMSLGAKLSFSKRLRKVFSVNNLRSSKSMGSLAGASSSNVSIATMDTTPDLYGDASSSASSVSSISSPITPCTPPPERSLRRRSFASLSTLFQKSAPSSPSPLVQQQKQQQLPTSETTVQQHIVIPDKKDRPTLRVDTTQSSLSPSSTRKAPFKGRSPVAAPESPNSSVSTRSRITKPGGHHCLASELPSPTPSSSSSSSSTSSTSNNNNNKQRKASTSSSIVATHPQNGHDEMKQLADDFDDLAMAPPPVIGVHYGLPMHGSPRLKPAAHSSSCSLIMDQVTPLASTSSSSASSIKRRRLQFCPTVQVHETFAAADYDRRCDNNSTCQKLTPSLALKIKQEINEYKLTEMDVHLESRQYTQFFL